MMSSAFLTASLSARGDVDRAVVLDVDGDAGLVDDALDGLAAGPMMSRI